MGTDGTIIDRALLERFAAEITDCLIRYAGLGALEARRLYQESFIPHGLEEAPEPLLHETPYYWAMFLVTKDMYVEQYPPDQDPGRDDEQLPQPILELLRKTYDEGNTIIAQRQWPGRPQIQAILATQAVIGTADTQLPEAPSGHLEVSPSLAFVTLAAPLRHEEDCPRLGTPFTNWVAYYRDRFDEHHKRSVYWWRRNGEPGGAVRLYNAYQHLLTDSLGPEARLGWEAVVAHACPYKILPKLPRSVVARAAREYLPDTLTMLLAAGVKVVVTVGTDMANEFASLAGVSLSKRWTRESVQPHGVHYAGYAFNWVPALYPSWTPKAVQLHTAGAIRQAL